MAESTLNRQTDSSSDSSATSNSRTPNPSLAASHSREGGNPTTLPVAENLITETAKDGENVAASGKFNAGSIIDHLDIWTSTIKQKSRAGRGNSKKHSLHGIKKLRELILELAVRGRLVPQDASDEPASVLLERIAAETLQLVKDKKIKKPKALPAINEDEKLFELPNGWVFERLGLIGAIFNGNSVNASLKEQKYTGLAEGYPFIATKDVGYGFEALDYFNGILIPIDEPKFKVAHKGAVLICAEGGSAGKKCGIANQNICFGNKLFAIELKGKLDPRFILSVYLTPTFFEQFSESMTGIIGGISTAKFSGLLIPIPPLAEQKRIIAKVDELMSLCDALEAQTEASITAHQTLVETLLNALLLPANSRSDSLEPTLDKESSPERLFENSTELSFEQSWQRVAEHFDTLFTTSTSIDTLKQTILQLAVTGKLVEQDKSDETAAKLLARIAAEKCQLIKNNEIKKKKPIPIITNDEKLFLLPKGWEWSRVVNCMDNTRDISYGIIKLEAEPESGGVPTLRCSDVKPRYIDLANVRNVSTEIETTYARTRLMGGEILINIRGTLGGVALVPKELAGFNIAREVAMLPLHSEISGNYLVNVIDSPFFWRMIESNLKGIAYKGLNLNLLRDFIIPLPPFEEQLRIVAKVDDLMALCDRLKARLSDAKTTQHNLTDAIVNHATGRKSLGSNERLKEVTPMEIRTTLTITSEFNGQSEATLAKIITSLDDADAKSVWSKSGLTLPDFYKQLKKEINAGFINLPPKADFI